MNKLIKKIKNKQAKIAICGLGKVGTAIATILAAKGFEVVGVDVDKTKLKTISRGEVPFEGKEPGLSKLIKSVVSSEKLKTSHTPAIYKSVDIIIVAISLPINKQTKRPLYTALKTVISGIAKNLSRNTLVIIESTIAPRTIDNIILPLLEKNSNLQVNKDFLLAHCPERVMPGRLLFNIQNYNRIIGGYNQAAAKTAKTLYKLLTKGDIDLTDTLTAEVVKTAENSYRNVQIAFANELSLICEDYGVNVWEVRKWVNKCPFRYVHEPGAGVGGYCIPKDPWLLIANLKDKRNSKIIPLASRFNDLMPRHIIDLLEEGFKQSGVKIKQAKVAILGYSYLKDSGDIRYSPTISLIRHLEGKVADIRIHDPWVKGFKKNIYQVVENMDAIILMTNHSLYQKLDLKKIKKIMKKLVIVDGRNAFNKQEVENLGFLYLGIGNVGDKK